MLKTVSRSSHLQMFCEKPVLKIFVEFNETLVLKSPLLKLQVYKPVTLLKNFGAVSFLRIFRIF